MQSHPKSEIKNQKPRNSLTQRRWKRFKKNKRGYYSLLIFSIFFITCLFAEGLSNDKPFLVSYEGNFYFPIFKTYPETVFGGDFETEADYRDPYILEKITENGNHAFFDMIAACSKVPPIPTPTIPGGQGLGPAATAV
ncbi:MAG: hypothetical protein KAI75_04080, partial [Desulfobulbaceae bacterium]|nr:hypothetical protein [Desulfobulbaceae bacterium]